MPYKKSRFNFTYRQSEDAYVVFNTYSKALVVLSSAEFEQFNAQHNCYKCWDQVGRVETCCFNITSPDKKNYSNIVKFMSWDPFRDEKCGQCVFLPVCFGGCKFHRLNTGKYDCGFTAESMKSYLENEFFSD